MNPAPSKGPHPTTILSVFLIRHGHPRRIRSPMFLFDLFRTSKLSTLSPTIHRVPSFRIDTCLSWHLIGLVSLPGEMDQVTYRTLLTFVLGRSGRCHVCPRKSFPFSLRFYSSTKVTETGVLFPFSVLPGNVYLHSHGRGHDSGPGLL